MRDDYLQSALKVIDNPNILVNVISTRVKQLRRGSRPLVESLEKLSLEDTALREVADRKISYELPTAAEMELLNPPLHILETHHERAPVNRPLPVHV